MIHDYQLAIVQVAYLIAAILFILGLKRLSSPATARSGNQLAALAMVLALVVTFVDPNYTWHWNAVNIAIIAVALIAGAAVGTYFARTVAMTAMPQMVALFNGMGGGTAALVSVAEFVRFYNDTGHVGGGESLSVVVGTTIGAISFSGSMIAFGKLQELISGRPIRFAGGQIVNAIILIAILALWVIVLTGSSTIPVWGLLAAALVLGVLVVLPIGGADMPVVIAVLNSMTGLAAAAAGFVLDNQILIVAGALVGASGALLTVLMSRAMNRSLANVMFGAFGSAPAGGAVAAGEAKPIRQTTAEDVAVQMAYANEVIIVPGYGLAVAQAQHQIRELADELEKRGVTVKYAIHPVAGRMPGHMNVLLAEANVPYDQLFEMESINDEFERADVALVVGANDVVNPAARHDKGSPIFGMPILNVDQARSVIVLKRSMRPGFAGIENELFHEDKTAMLFGDAKASLAALTNEVKAA
ncbi:MAG TPA: NAD(P)(+) transhydrogenase (Re/Si-specific) subunit beta [Thermomicrobiaceae bacterium]|nr:NAD(P)(+) transhydrogenase (Re/Si-specific) subunit beta [Thermomicrobiaceae bacterium]